MDSEVWSIECTLDELLLDLCRTKEVIEIDRGFYVDGKRSIKTFIVHKYYRQARELMRWIPRVRPDTKEAPEFVINANDLSPKVIEELEIRANNLPAIGYILKQAAGRVFENMDYEFYHLSIARNLRVRMEP